LLKRIQEPRRFIQVLAGPRQVGKTTIARQVMEAVSIPVHFATADEPTLRDRTWITQQWEIARLKMNEKNKKKGALLIFDETQKVTEWSEIIKRLWDEDTHSGLPLKVVLLGSSPLLIQRGLTESLAGRFEIIPVTHWSYVEMRDAFGWNLEQYILYGGYPGAAGLIEDQERWARYIIDSLIETTISRDILLLTRVDKPALLRRLFQLCCDYSGQVLSYQKMLGHPGALPRSAQWGGFDLRIVKVFWKTGETTIIEPQNSGFKHCFDVCIFPSFFRGRSTGA
jgi:predicted AAA+ superfamily ATPase